MAQVQRVMSRCICTSRKSLYLEAFTIHRWKVFPNYFSNSLSQGS